MFPTKKKKKNNVSYYVYSPNKQRQQFENTTQPFRRDKLIIILNAYLIFSI